mmetsp:Transcript_74713/g.189666  ORF Transcript_74713/g.189666 Transcript_74713/m.189666 type:complete len:398 (+) Transcript_74713:449-1642(+)
MHICQGGGRRKGVISQPAARERQRGLAPPIRRIRLVQEPLHRQTLRRPGAEARHVGRGLVAPLARDVPDLQLLAALRPGREGRRGGGLRRLVLGEPHDQPGGLQGVVRLLLVDHLVKQLLGHPPQRVVLVLLPGLHLEEQRDVDQRPVKQLQRLQIAVQPVPNQQRLRSQQVQQSLVRLSQMDSSGAFQHLSCQAREVRPAVQQRQPRLHEQVEEHLPVIVHERDPSQVLRVVTRRRLARVDQRSGQRHRQRSFPVVVRLRSCCINRIIGQLWSAEVGVSRRAAHQPCPRDRPSESFFLGLRLSPLLAPGGSATFLGARLAPRGASVVGALQSAQGSLGGRHGPGPPRPLCCPRRLCCRGISRGCGLRGKRVVVIRGLCGKRVVLVLGISFGALVGT